MPVELPERLAGPGLPPASRKEFRLTGGHVLAMLVTFFLVVASVNAYMMTLAVTTMPGLDARNGYDTSQNFNRDEFAAAEAQAARHWQSEAKLSLANRVLSLSLDFLDKDGKPIDGLVVSALIAHPAQRRLDRAIALSPRGPGLYAAEVEGIEAGAWGLVIEARSAQGGERQFLSRHRVILRDERR